MTRRGFTLLEMLVATAIMAIAVVGLMGGLSTSARNAARLRNYDRAVQLAQLRMNELLLDDELPLATEIEGEFDETVDGGVPSGWKARLSRFEMPPFPAAGQLALDRLELEIWWMEGSQRHTLALDGYRRRILRQQDIPPVGAPQ